MHVRRASWAAMIITLGASSAFAVSDGYYDPSRMLCTEYSNTTGAGAVPGCYDAIIEVADASGHIYFGAGARQVDLNAQPAQTFDVWVDPGLGVKYTFTVSRSSGGITPPTMTPSTPAQPQQGLYLSLGGDGNLER